MSSTSVEQDALLERMGLILYTNLCQDSVGFIFYGIYLVLFSVCLRMTLARPLNAFASKVLLGAILLLFLSTTAQFISDMMGIVTQVRTYLIHSEVPLEDRRPLWTNTYFALKIVGAWPVMINFMLSDLIVVWRAWVMYPHTRIVKVVLAIIAFADIVLWFYSQGLVSKHVRQPGNPDVDKQLSTASNFISFGTNVIGTGLIALQAWDLNKYTDKRRRGEVARVLLILVETGALFAVVQLVNSVLGEVYTDTHTPLGLATTIFGKAAIYIAAILPTATIIIIRSNRSLDTSITLNSVHDSSPGISTKLSSLQFRKIIRDDKGNIQSAFTNSERSAGLGDEGSKTRQSSHGEDGMLPAGLESGSRFGEKASRRDSMV